MVAIQIRVDSTNSDLSVLKFGFTLAILFYKIANFNISHTKPFHKSLLKNTCVVLVLAAFLGTVKTILQYYSAVYPNSLPSIN